MKLTVFFFLLTLTAYAQNSLRGQVINDADEQPVPFCSVFLANTTKGTTADSTGQFVLANVPAGRFELVVSSVGFETRATPLGNEQSSPLLIRLKPLANQLAEVQVRASRDPAWLENLGVFNSFFIGTSKNAAQCAIKNQNALWFDDDRADRKLTAGAREPLVIENRALGYQIRYSLVQFQFDYGRNYVSYLGYPVYEPMKPQNRREALRWEKARREAYLGSAMHFMRAVHTRTTDDEGFEVRRVLERTDSTKTTVTNRPKSAATWQVKTTRFVINDKLPGTFLIDDNQSSDSLTVLAFENLIQITYTQERESTEYLRSVSPFSIGAAGPQTSLMYLTQPYVTVERNGNFQDQLGIIFEGYWGWEKMAELLPLTYEP